MFVFLSLLFFYSLFQQFPTVSLVQFWCVFIKNKRHFSITLFFISCILLINLSLLDWKGLFLSLSLFLFFFLFSLDILIYLIAIVKTCYKSTLPPQIKLLKVRFWNVENFWYLLLIPSQTVNFIFLYPLFTGWDGYCCEALKHNNLHHE